MRLKIHKFLAFYTKNFQFKGCNSPASTVGITTVAPIVSASSSFSTVSTTISTTTKNSGCGLVIKFKYPKGLDFYTC